LLSVIRFSYLSNEDLVGCSTNKFFEEAKDLIVEGLAVRLNPESALQRKAEFKINLNPRILYLPKHEKDVVLPDGKIIHHASCSQIDPQITIEADGTEIIDIDGKIEETKLNPIDNETGLP